MATEEDKDPAIVDWGEQANTTLDAAPLEETPPEPDTRPHAIVAELVAAREEAVARAREEATKLGYVEGQRNATQAFRRVLAERGGLAPLEVDRVVEWAARYMDAL